LEFSDEQLVREIRAGSSVAFEKLMGRYERLVYRVAYGFTGERESAMDVTHNTFLKVHTRLSTWRWGGSFRGWLTRIAANEAISWNRARRRRPTAELNEDLLLDPEPVPEAQASQLETRQTLLRALDALNPKQRLAVVLRYFQGMGQAEIAEALECSEGTARTMVFRGLRKMRAVLAPSMENVP
jgi:RNA polymerase sigma-70 factor (ECF subfamily)